MLNFLSHLAASEQQQEDGDLHNHREGDEVELEFQSHEVREVLTAVKRASVLVDKYKALQEVTRLAPQYPDDLGHGNDLVMPAILDMLPHGSDVAIDCLSALVDETVGREKSPSSQQLRSPQISAAQKNVRAFLSRGGIEALLNLLGNGGSDVRLRVLQLTRTLFEVDEAEVEKAIVQSPMGMQQLVQVLDDREEQTRNQLLLLLLAITGRSHSPELQNFLAFAEGFERLLAIIVEETQQGGGSVVSLDCLRLLCNVVHGSAVTSKLFLSMADLKLLPQLLVIDPTRHLVAGSQVDPLKRGLILHTLDFLATLLNIAPEDSQEGGEAGSVDKPAATDGMPVIIGPAADLAASRFSEQPQLVRAVALIALSHPGVLRGRRGWEVGKQERVKALRVLKRLVSGNGQAVAVLLAEEGGLESLLAHYLSPLVIQEEHEEVEGLLQVGLADSRLGSKLVQVIISTGPTVKRRGAMGLGQLYLSEGLEEEEALRDVLPGLVSLRATSTATVSTAVGSAHPGAASTENGTSSSPVRRGSASSPPPPAQGSPMRDPSSGLVQSVVSRGGGLLGGLAKALAGEQAGVVNISAMVPGMAASEDGLWKLLYRSMHGLVETPVAWSEEEGARRAPRLLRAVRATRLLRHLLGHGGPPCRAACLEAAVRCTELAPPLPQLSGVPLVIPVFDGALQVLAHHAARSVWSPSSTSSTTSQQPEGNWEEGLLSLASAQLLATWILETPQVVHRFLSSPHTWRLLDLLAWLSQQHAPSFPRPHDGFTALLAAHLGCLLAMLFAVALESIGDDEHAMALGQMQAAPPSSPCPTRLSLLRAIASRMDVCDFLKAVECGRRLWTTGGLDLGQALDGEQQQQGPVSMLDREQEGHRAFRRIAGREVTGRLYDAAFVAAVGTVADRATARVVRTLAYKGEQDEEMAKVMEEDVGLKGLRDTQCARLIAEQANEMESLRQRLAELELKMAAAAGVAATAAP